MIRLAVREGGTVRTVRLEGGRIEIGSGSSASLRLRGAGISPRHCVLRVLRAGLEVLDQASREGTILNGTRVGRSSLHAGDILTLGSASVVVEEIGARSGDRVLRVAPPPRPEPRIPILVTRAAGPPESFDLQLYRAVRRSPPVLASVGLHVAAAILALVAAPEPAASAPARSAVFVSSDARIVLEEDAGGPGEEEDLLAAGAMLPEPETDLPMPEMDRPIEESPAPEPVLLPRSLPPSKETIGVGGGRRPPATVRIDANAPFEGGGADDANRSAAGLVLDGLGGSGSGERALLRKLDPRRVLVVKGCYDRVEDTLSLLGVGHDTLTPSEIAAAPLPPGAILIIDCDTDPLDDRAVKSVRAFVNSGGFLCTTDWALENVIERAFPGVLRSLAEGGRGVSTQNEVVPMRIVAPTHPLVRGLRAAAEDASWWVEDKAHPVQVLDKERVTVLAESRAFQERYGSGVLAVTFPSGRGRVLHLLGHAWQKEGNLRGTYALQRMILNFLLERAAAPEK